MKNYLKLMLLPLFASLLITGCDSEQYFYSGPEYVLFEDSTHVFGVDGAKEENLFEITMGATTVADVDRNFSVEINLEKTNAIEGVHFDVVTPNIVIKAGERIGKVTLRGYYDKIQRQDNLGVCLRLIADEQKKFEKYGDETHVSLVKCNPFDINNFVGRVCLLATFPFSNQLVTLYRETELKNDSTVILKDMFQRGMSVEVVFHHNNALDDLISIKEQDAFVDSNYGLVRLRGIKQYPSYYNSPDRFFVLYMEAYVPRFGSFGPQQFILRWMSEEEYEMTQNQIPYLQPQSMTNYSFQH